MTDLFAGLTARTGAALALLLAALVAFPALADPYLLTVAITTLWLAYVGQAWNLMMGFAGLLSLGHALYVGLGAYAAAGLYVHAGLGPWLGVLLGMAIAAAAGTLIGLLGFRFGVRGVHFALLTIAFAEFTRIAFDHLPWFGGSGGFFLPVDAAAGSDLLALRGGPVLFYYVILAMTVLALGLCRLLTTGRLGLAWQAVREDQEAAAAAGIDVLKAKLAAVAISAALTAPAGVFLAFFHNNLFPEQTFAMMRSIEIIIAPIVGGVGTLFGPLLGAFVLTPLSEGLSLALQAVGYEPPGLKQFLYGLALVLIVLYLPEGLWPRLGARLARGSARREAAPPAGGAAGEGAPAKAQETAR